ncbi:hypothetical protein BDV26DRAFT_164695 [Aspergillus bertholletiae]|uniref:Inositol monophosphatase n=1 Tax=Aspergillus bertholletiae TaxID=1226010 RepID=A0A5N7BCJ6_9EURO|nr:hypothetical protein BDV26DRAFT_164695 [Aspergillus bertholletiae]
MPTPNYKKEFLIACLAVHRASILTKMAQGDPIGPKSDGSLVAVADYAAQAILISVLRHHFPGDAFVGRVSASMLREDPVLAQRVWAFVSAMAGVNGGGGNTGQASAAVVPQSVEEMMGAIEAGGGGNGAEGFQRTWFLDPINGSAAFKRNQQYAVSVALVEGGEQKVGVIGCPNLAFESTSVHEDVIDKDGYGVMLFAVKGQGAYIQQMTLSGLGPAQRISLSPWQRMGEEIMLAESSTSDVIHQEKHKQIRDVLLANPVVDLDSMQVKYVALTIGACNAMVWLPRDKDHRFPVWDHAGAMIIFEESGGKVTDLCGRPFNYARGRRLADNEGLVAAKPGLHAGLLRYSRFAYERTKSG